MATVFTLFHMPDQVVMCTEYFVALQTFQSEYLLDTIAMATAFTLFLMIYQVDMCTECCFALQTFQSEYLRYLRGCLRGLHGRNTVNNIYAPGALPNGTL